MDSDSNSSLRLPSTDLESSRSSKRGVLAKAVWAYTRMGRPDTTEDPKQRYCLVCERENLVPIYATTVTTNQRNHLKSKHSVTIEVERELSPLHSEVIEQLQQLYLKAESSGKTSEIDTKVFQRYLHRATIDEALISLVVMRNLPFRIVEWPEFHTLCRVLNPESIHFLTTAHSEVRRKLGYSWISSKDIIRRKLQSAISSIHLSLDIWTSPQGYLLLGVVAHFVERQDESLIKALLALRVVAGHSGADQFAVLLPTLKDYGIIQKLGGIVSDNASTNDTLCRAVEAYLLESEGLKWNASQWRIRCLGHILNLSVQTFLFHNVFAEEELQGYEQQEVLGVETRDEEKQAKFRLLGPLGQLHNIVVHIHNSPSRIAEFLVLAGRMIPLDNRTRWNSWYLMLEVALKHSTSLDTYSKAHFVDLEEDYLSPKDWDKLEMIFTFLKPFHRATLETQGDAATIDRVLFTMDIIIGIFKKGLVSNIY
jgi:hypothetical protein